MMMADDSAAAAAAAAAAVSPPRGLRREIPVQMESSCSSSSFGVISTRRGRLFSATKEYPYLPTSYPEAVDLLRTVSGRASRHLPAGRGIHRKQRQQQQHRLRFLLHPEDYEPDPEVIERDTSGPDSRCCPGCRKSDCFWDCRDSMFFVSADVIDDVSAITCSGGSGTQEDTRDAFEDRAEDNCERLIVGQGTSSSGRWFRCCGAKSRSTSGGELGSSGGSLLSPASGLKVISSRCGVDRRKAKDWRRWRRCAFLCSILIGLVVAIGGIVIGFIIWHGVTTANLNSGHDHDHLVAMETLHHPIDAQPIDDVTIATNAGNVVARDESGWAFFVGGSINGSRYRTINRAMTFYGAQEHCRRLGGYLARVNSIREQVFLEDFLREELRNEDVWPGGVGFWIGARRARGSHGDTCMFDQWKWTDSYGRSHGSISGFTAFVPGKPDNYFSPEECLFMSYREGENEERFLKWDDAPCDLNSVGGIKALCEIETR